MYSTVAFTVCSINYLSQAITLGNSLKKSNPKIDFRIYVVDKFEGRENLKHIVPYPVIEIHNVPVDDFDGMCRRYNVIELNTSVKPFIFDYIFKTEPHINNVIYFDPDIKVYESLNKLLEQLLTSSIVLTPHILTPSDDHPYGQAERNYLMGGIFNLGFIALSNHHESLKFLDWWKARLVNQGYADASMHLFYDQKWLNFAPVFFDRVYIEKSPGYNMAGWNLHERVITSSHEGKYIINNKFTLCFFHFSGVKVNEFNISVHTNYTFQERPDLFEIISDYRNELKINSNECFILHKCYYSKYYQERIVYYPKYHWITMCRRTRFNLGKLKRLVFKTND
jgi:lipopolysaccharide biosynthesis glycosyltransferase